MPEDQSIFVTQFSVISNFVCASLKVTNANLKISPYVRPHTKNTLKSFLFLRKI